MGLMSRAAVEPDAMGNKATDSRWLFPLRRFEEELLEHILMSASCSNPWPGRRGGKEAESGTQGFPVAKERSNVTDVVQRKIEKIGKNVVGKVKVLKQVFTESLDKGSEKEAGRASREECRKVACNEIVRATLHRHPGSQLPDVFVCTLQAHFDSFPNRYLLVSPLPILSCTSTFHSYSILNPSEGVLRARAETSLRSRGESLWFV